MHFVGKRMFEGRSRIEVESERGEGALAVTRDDSHRLRRDRTDAHPTSPVTGSAATGC